MRDSLERIRTWLKRKAPHLVSSLQPGLSLAEMQQIMGTKSAKYRIPDEIVELYAWHNGQADYVPFFDVLRFQPFQDAVKYANLVEPYSGGQFPLMVFQELNYDAGYIFKCSAEEQKSAPAYLWIHGGEEIETTSLTDLLSAVAEAFESGVFRPNDQGELDSDEDAWNAIVVRHHPDRIRPVGVLLDHRFRAMSAEDVRNAFFDLERMNHPATASLVREYLEREPDGRPWDFETYFAVLGVGIERQDAWSRDYAQDLILETDSSVRGRALSLLAWRWRGDLALTAKHVDGLIEQIANSPAGDHANRERAMLLRRSGDPRSIPVLRRLLEQSSPAPLGHGQNLPMRDTRIAALRALGTLQDTEATGIYLNIAENDPDPGTRISAVRALIEMGFEDAQVEAAAKKWIRERFAATGQPSEKDEPPALRRWIEQVRKER